MRPTLLSPISLLLVLASMPLQAQESLPPLKAEVSLEDFGMDRVADVMRGRISLVHAPDGPRLRVYFLRRLPTPPAGPAPDAEAVAVPEVPEVEAPGEALPEPAALWVWNTRELLADAEAREAFLDFVGDHGFRNVFLQLVPGEGEAARDGFVPFDSEATGALVGRLSDRGVSAYALDGDPNYVRPENHAGVLATVERVLEHNGRVAPEERFAGIRYDIEPYLAAGFQGPGRPAMLQGYAELVSTLSARVGQAGLRLGVDIPFWLDGPDEETGEPFTVEVDGGRRSLLRHVLGSVDDVAVMDYRTVPGGPDGSVAYASGELAAAAEEGARVFVAVETETLPDEELFSFAGSGWEGLPPERGRWIVVGPGTGRGTAAVWLVEGAAGVAALEAEAASTEGGPAAFRHWPAGLPSPLPADKQSFAGLGAEAMRRAVARLVAAVGDHPAFAGVAYHHYGSLSRLLEDGG